MSSCVVAPVDHGSTLVSALTSGHSSLLGTFPEALVASAAPFPADVVGATLHQPWSHPTSERPEKSKIVTSKASEGIGPAPPRPAPSQGPASQTLSHP